MQDFVSKSQRIHLNTPEILTELTKSKIIVSIGRNFERNTD